MNEPDLFDSLRAAGIDADDPRIRAAVRTVTDEVDQIGEEQGPHLQRRCMEAMAGALSYLLRHPDVGHMGRFEDEFDDDAGPATPL